jgi:hypothetical protein
MAAPVTVFLPVVLNLMVEAYVSTASDNPAAAYPIQKIMSPAAREPCAEPYSVSKRMKREMVQTSGFT